MDNNQGSINQSTSNSVINNQPLNPGVQNQPTMNGNVNYQPQDNQVYANNGYNQQVNVGGQPVVNNANINQPIVNNMNYQQQGYVTQPVANTYNNGMNNQMSQPMVNNMNYQPQYNNYNQFNSQPNMGNNSKFKAFWQNKNNKIISIALIVAVVVLIINLIVFSSNNMSEGGGHKNAKYDRTIMLYMVGSNLEEGSGLATLDLQGIDYNQLENNKTKLIVIAGGATKWHNSFIDVNSTSIYELTANGYNKVKDQSRRNMGDASVLSNFLNYGYDKYPAKKYDLIFWNHGMGVLGGESDSISGDFLLLSEFKSGLNNSKFKGNNKLELILFRTCLNGTIEVADTLKEHANFMVASQEITRGYQGNNFLKVLNTISNTDDAKQFGIKYVDAYMKYIDDARNVGINPYTLYSTYSVIDLTKLNNVEESLNDFIKDINTTSNYSQIAKARAPMLQYAGKEDPSYDSVDLYTLVESIQSLSSSKAQKVLSALKEAIVYSKASDTRSKGLAIYFPYNGDKDMREAIVSKIYNFSGLKDYGSFISSFNKMRSSNASPLSFAANEVDINHNSKNGETDFQLKLTDGQMKTFAKAEYLVFQQVNESSYLPVYSSESVILEDNTLKANIKDRQLKVTDKSDKSEQVLTLIEDANTDEYILYHSFVLLSNYDTNYTGDDLKIMQAKIVLKLDKKTNKVSVESVSIKGEANDDSNKKGSIKASDTYSILASLEDYKYITFTITSRKILNEQGNYSNEWVDDTPKVFQMETKNLSFGLEDYSKSKKYYSVFKISDIYGNVSYSKLIELK